MLNRLLRLPTNKSFFLLGPRQTGKTTLLNSIFTSSTSKKYNLLLSSEYSKLITNPSVLYQEIKALPPSITHIVIDEVQRIPQLLNEVQALMNELPKLKFILTGSSARKLKRGNANLLAGRALNFKLFPLTYQEINKDFNLNDIINFGSLPHIYTNQNQDDKTDLLRSYVEVYLQEEIQAEALSRNIGGFLRFLKIAAQTNTELCNFSNIARDVSLSPVTVKEYFQILEDTLIGNFLLPFHHSERKKHKLSPKFYFFDTGVVRAAEQKLNTLILESTFEYGKYFESWIINEIIRINHYLKKDWQLSFLRTANDVEVDLIIETPKQEVIAIEIKSKALPIEKDFVSGFLAVKRLVDNAKCICVCTGESRIVNGYKILNYKEFIEMISKI